MRSITSILIALCVLSFSSAYAFTARDGTNVIVGSAGAGALLGLSTLSFGEKPQQRFRNIAIGASLGVIAGVGITIYLAATDDTIYERIDPIEDEELFMEDEEFVWKGTKEVDQTAVAMELMHLRF